MNKKINKFKKKMGGEMKKNHGRLHDLEFFFFDSFIIYFLMQDLISHISSILSFYRD